MNDIGNETGRNRSRPFPRDPAFRDVLVIGGGASGVLIAAHLLAQPGPLRVTLIERSHLLGCGIAYSTTDPDHLLNTRVHNMSAFPDRPEHFLGWLQKQPDVEGAEAGSFVSRQVYGRYLADLLTPWRGGDRLRCLRASCERLEEGARGVVALLEDGTRVTGNHAVIATGHVLPRPDPEGLISGAWQSLPAPDPEGRVIIIGTGLSMVDQVLSLERAGHRGPILALSRRGLLPRAHAAAMPLNVSREEVPFGAPVSRLLAWLRRLAREATAKGGTWRDAVDGMRPFVSAIWQAMDPDQRRRFLRHAVSWWEVHRHRIPPASEARIRAATSAGQLTIRRAAFIRAEADSAVPGGVVAVIAPRGEAGQQRIPAARIIDCRGIRNDPARNASPLIAGLLEGGAARIDPLRLGLDISILGRLISEEGVVSNRIWAIGPVSRATFWEITAIPDIRLQARDMAEDIAASVDETLRLRGDPAAPRGEGE